MKILSAHHLNESLDMIIVYYQQTRVLINRLFRYMAYIACVNTAYHILYLNFFMTCYFRKGASNFQEIGFPDPGHYQLRIPRECEHSLRRSFFEIFLRRVIFRNAPIPRQNKRLRNRFLKSNPDIQHGNCHSSVFQSVEHKIYTFCLLVFQTATSNRKCICAH